MISFDIFDTLLRRLCDRPEAVFELMRRQIQLMEHIHFSQNFIQDFPRIRTFSALKARELKRHEATFDEIYQFIAEKNDLDSEQLRLLQSIEIETEKRILFPILENIALLHGFLDRGERVILLSDMYYSSAQLRELMATVSPRIVLECDIIVSSEYDKTKRSGELFNEVLKRFSLCPEELTHYGDDSIADVSIPKSLGIRCVPVKKKSLPPWEHNLSTNGSAPLAVASGISSLLDYESSVEHVGGAIAGPVLYSYVFWLLSTAREAGMRQLFFLSRDGHILKKIAERLQPVIAPDIKLHYLHISRLAVVTASYFELDDNRCWDFILLDHPNVTIHEMAQRLLLSDEEFISALQHQGRQYLPSDTVDFDNAGWIRWCVNIQPQLKQIIEQRSEKARKNLLQYLHQSHTLSPHSALVDVGWKGTIQDTLSLILEKTQGVHSLTGYYFGLAEYTNRQNKQNKKFAYAFYPYTQTPYDHAILRFLEVFTHVNEGMTLSYADDGTPRLAESFETNNAYAVSDLQQGILKFVNKAIALGLHEDCCLDDDYALCLQELEHPNRALAEAMGDYLYLLGTNDELCMPLAPRENALSFCLRKLKKQPPLWQGGYDKRLSLTAKTLSRLFQLARNFFRCC